jgi:hypothetical protein
MQKDDLQEVEPFLQSCACLYFDTNSSLETNCGMDEEDSNPSSVTSSATIRSDPDQEVAQEEVTTPNEIPSGWTLVKLEPDC